MVAFFSFTEQVSLIIRNIYVTGQAWQNVGRKIRKRFPLLKMILKLIAAPFALVLTLLIALCWFLFDLCAFFLTIASVIVAVLGIGLFFTPTPLGGFVFLFLTFLLSPYGLQAMAISLIGMLNGGKPALCRFLVS